MGKPTGFLEIPREKQPYRPVEERIRDWKQVMLPWVPERMQKQGARCMDCGIPFCHKACPLGNVIPDWNDLVYRNLWREAAARLHATTNFPEFTGTLCPAPCEGSCVLGINDQPVTIRAIELAIIEHAFDSGWVVAEPPVSRSGKSVAVIGSGPAGLAAAQQLNRAGHWVTVFERAGRIGGLLRYGIPSFKLEKGVLDRRLDLLQKEGIRFQTGAHVGVNVSVEAIRGSFDAILLAGGAAQPRDLRVPGRELKGIHFAMEYLPIQNRRCEGDAVPEDRSITATGKRVVIIGGGDTGADCLGTAHRQGARSVHQFELLESPPKERSPDNPWPLWPNVFRTSSAHEEGGVREYCISTKSFSGRQGRVERLHGCRIEFVLNEHGQKVPREIPGGEFEMEVDLVLLAMGFIGPERGGLLDQLGARLSERGTVAVDECWMTSTPGVFAAGDMRRGQSLIVWAIAEGRQAAKHIDRYLMGSTNLP